jgi:proteasome accessory factor B
MLPPTSFTPQEALSLLVLCYELGRNSALPFFDPARSAALKIESNLPPRLRDYLREVHDAVRIRLESCAPLNDHEQVYNTLLESIRRSLSVRLTYDSLNDGREPGESTLIRTKLSPFQLVFSRRSWYVLGRSSLHRQLRTFNLQRVRQIELLLNDPFTRPKTFKLDRFLRNAWHLIPEPGPDLPIVVRFEKMVARNVADVSWHKTQQVEFLPDGACLFRATVSGLNEVSWWILGYGDQAEVLEPPPLRELVARRVQKMADRYHCNGSSPAAK